VSRLVRFFGVFVTAFLSDDTIFRFLEAAPVVDNEVVVAIGG
jgi:hypothetical protein